MKGSGRRRSVDAANCLSKSHAKWVPSGLFENTGHSLRVRKDAPPLLTAHHPQRKSIALLCAGEGERPRAMQAYFFGALPCGALWVAVFI
ncbi:hypothetical protein RHEC894_CH01257 [Rhizobium sp. CIAT894]|nr:hypothetical protein RHEC894_CH01257 [Rhizobium sp. CIAT894]